MILEKEVILNSLEEDKENKLIEIFEQNNFYVEYYDYEVDGDRFFYFDENLTLVSLRERIYASDKVLEKINIDELTRFIYDVIDRNALMVLKRLFFINSKEDLSALYEETEDDYALEIMDDVEFFGRNWTDKSIIVINIGKIIETVKETEKEDLELGLQSSYYLDLYKEILITVIHEFRHLVYNCNPYVPEEEYPNNLNNEKSVEDYSRNIFDKITEVYHIIN